MSALHYSLVQAAVAQSDLTTIAQYMFWLMFRNVASDGFVFAGPGATPVCCRYPGACSPRRRGRTPPRT